MAAPQTIIETRRAQMFPALEAAEIERVRRFGEVRAFADGVPDHAHLGGPRVELHDLPPKQEGVHEPEDRDPQDHPEGHHFEGRGTKKMRHAVPPSASPGGRAGP